MRQGDELVLFLSWPQVLPYFFERSPESLRGWECAETQHRIVSLLDTAVITLDVAIEEPIIPVLDLATQYFPNCPWVGIQPVRGHSFWSSASHWKALRKKRWAAAISRFSPPSTSPHPRVVKGERQD